MVAIYPNKCKDFVKCMLDRIKVIIMSKGGKIRY